MVTLGIYRPPAQQEEYVFIEISKALDNYSTTNENFILVCDFNTEQNGQNIRNFLDAYGLNNLVKSLTCHKSDSSTWIDLILTNRSRSFKNTQTIETGLSDFHEMIVTVFRSGFVKKGPKLILYRDYKNFDVQAFRIEFTGRQSEVASDQGLIENYAIFNDIVSQLLDQHASLKKKHVRENDRPFMNKTLRKAIMRRSHLRKKYNKNKNDSNLKLYKKQRNQCVKLLRKAKMSYYKNLDTTMIYDNRKFWRTVKPLFSDKVQVPTSLTLLENNNLISNDKEVAEVFNNYFANITDALGIKEITGNISSVSGLVDPIDIAIKKYCLHPSIRRIQSNMKYTERFTFSEVSIQQVALQLARLDPKKSSPVGAIPANILKEYPDILAQNLCNLFNQSVAHNTFPLELQSWTKGYETSNVLSFSTVLSIIKWI